MTSNNKVQDSSQRFVVYARNVLIMHMSLEKARKLTLVKVHAKNSYTGGVQSFTRGT